MIINKGMARDFLAGLDPIADKFTFQFFSDSGSGRAQIFHGTLEDLWPLVQALNTPKCGLGVFVTINETDFKGRSAKNIVRVRALFVDADCREQVERCIETFTACGAKPSMIVKSGRGMHFYFVADVPLDQFSALQSSLIVRVGTDAAVKDLPRVMRLPGTLHLKNPAEPRLVKLLSLANAPARRCHLTELVAKLELSPVKPALNQLQDLVPAKFTVAQRDRLHKIFGYQPAESLGAGLETDIEEIRSAASAIPPSAISTEGDWMKFARALAHEAAVHKGQAEQLWKILDAASLRAPGYDEAENQSRWSRYIGEAFKRENPITIATVFDLAKKHGWQGWSPPITSTTRAPIVPSAHAHKVSFANIPHRKWLYGVDLVRGEITLVGSPGGTGKTSLALGMTVSIAVGKPLLDEKIFGGGLKALYINAEDSGLEMRRRTWGFCSKHGITEQDLGRLYLAGTDDPQVQHLSFLRTNEKNFSVLDRGGFDQLENLFSALRPDLVTIDPLIAMCGGGNVNDNATMSLVMRELKRLAIKYDCAILIVLHTKKGGDPNNAEAISGASAIVNLARRVIMPVTMTDEECKKFRVLPSERFRYFKVVDAKTNLAPRSQKAPWYELCSVELPNPEPPVYQHGDRVQAIARANFALLSTTSAAVTADDQKVRKAIMEIVRRGKLIDGRCYPYSPSLAGAQNQRSFLDDAMSAVETATSSRQWPSGDLKAVTIRALEGLKSEGLVVDKTMKELMPKSGRFPKGRGLALAGQHVSPPEANAHIAAETGGGGQLVNSPVN